MRLFFAIELTDEARREVAALQADLKRTNSDVKWVKPENLHLTLKFLGEMEENRLPELRQAAEEAVVSFSPFLISLEGVGAFPGARHPRVIWVGVQKGKEPLTALASHIEEACGSFMLRQAQHERHPITLSSSKGERPFSPHLTIGRCRSVNEPLSVPSFKTSEPIRVDRLVLLQSKLSPHGSTYLPLAEIPFKP